MLCALKDVEGNLWFGNINGTLTVYHVRTGRFVTHSLLVDGVANRASVWALYMDDKNRLYVGTETGFYCITVRQVYAPNYQQHTI